MHEMERQSRKDTRMLELGVGGLWQWIQESGGNF